MNSLGQLEKYIEDTIELDNSSILAGFVRKAINYMPEIFKKLSKQELKRLSEYVGAHLDLFGLLFRGSKELVEESPVMSKAEISKKKDELLDRYNRGEIDSSTLRTMMNELIANRKMTIKISKSQ